MDQGLLVPDELTCDLVVDRIQQPDAKNGYVLDGFPRTIPQAECLTDALSKLGSKIDYAIVVDKRLSLLMIYIQTLLYSLRLVIVTKHKILTACIDYYTGQGVLKTVDGTKNLDEVFGDIVKILGE